MNDYILMPSHINNIQSIYSNHIKDIFQSADVIDNRLPLDKIRQLYVEDRDKFIKVIDELTLRGFQFYTEKPNNILPSFSCEMKRFINVSSNQDFYQKLNFQRLGLTGFISRFKVDNDFFFHNIPVECFKYINASINDSEIIEEFQLAGFKITSPESTQCKPEPLQSEKNQPEEPFRSQPSNSITKEDPVPFKVKTYNRQSRSDSLLIEDIFHENKYNLFRRFCHKNHIDSAEEITVDLLNAFKNTKGVGLRRYEMVLDRLESYGFAYLRKEENNNDEAFVISSEKIFASFMTIEDFFYENKFKKFITYCNDTGLKRVSEIKNKHIKEFSDLPGVGKKKVDDITEKLQALSEELDAGNQHVFSSGDLYPYLKAASISHLLEMLEIEADFRSNMLVSELEGKDLREIEGLGNPAPVYELSYELQKLSSPETVLKEAKSKLTDRDQVIVNMRFLEDKTLEETGRDLDITRERVRQLENKLVDKLAQYLDNNRFHYILLIVFTNKLFITYDELLSVIGKENADILQLLKQKDTSVYYAEELNAFFLEKEKRTNFIHRLEDIIEELPETFNLKDYKNSLDHIFGTDHHLNYRDILEFYGYNQYGTLFSLNRLNIINVIEYIFQYYIHEPLTLDEPSVDILRELAEKHFDYQLGDSLRSIQGRIRDSENIILVDKNTFQWFEPDMNDQHLIDEIRSYLTNVFENREVINVKEIYQNFEAKLTENRIFNKYHLYSLIKYFLDDEFIIGKGNTLNIYREKDNKLSVEDRVIKTIKSFGGTCSRDQLEETLKWPRYKIDLAISSSNQVVTWERNRVKLFDSLLTEDEKAELMKLVEKSMKNGYTTSTLIFEQMMFHPRLAPLIQKKEINTSTKVSAIVKNIMPSVKGRQKFLYKEGSRFTSFEEVIVDHFRDEVNRSEMQAFILEHGYKELMASNILDKILKHDYFMEIDLGVYYPTDKFHISEEAVQALQQFLKEKTGHQEFISLSNVEGYRSSLPPIDFRWNPFLMKSILTHNGYRQIEKKYNDYRYDMILLVSESSTIKTFDELVYTLIKNQYNGNMHESEVYDFLADKGVLRKKNSEKTLPYEIRSESDLVYVDEIGIVHVR